MRQYFASSVCCMLTCIAASADVLILKGGDYRIEGTITESGDICVITTLGGEVMSFPKNVVASIIRKPSPDRPPGASTKQTVVLKDGRRFTGEINGNSRPNEYLIFTSDKSVQIVPKADVVRIIGSAPSYPVGNPAPVPPPPAPNAVAPVPTNTPPVAPSPPQASPVPAPGTALAAVNVPATPSELASTIHFRVRKTIVLEDNLAALKGGWVAAISPDLSRCVLRGKSYGSVDMVNLDTRQVIPFTTMFNRTWRFAFSPDSKLLAGAGTTLQDAKDKVVTIRLWDTQTGREVAVLDKMPDMVLSGSGNVVNGITFDRTSSYVAITGSWSSGRATDPSFIKIYSVGGGQYQKLQDLKLEHSVAGHAPLAFSPDNKAVYVRGYPPGKPQLHRVSLVAPSSPPEVIYELDHDANVIADGAPLAVRGQHQKEVFDLERKQVMGTIGTSHEVEDMAFSPDNRSLCVGTGSHADLPDHLAVWDVVERKRVSVLPDSAKFHRLDVLRFSADGRQIAAAVHERDLCTIRIWEMTSAPIAEAPGSQLTVKETFRLPEGDPVAVSHDFGRCLLARSRPEQTVLCDTSTGKELAVFEGAWKFQFSPDSKYLAGCGGNKDELYIKHTNTIRIWDAHTGRELAMLESMPVDANFSSDDIYHSPLVFDRAGNSLAVVCCGSVKLFSAASNSFRKILDRPLSREEGRPLQTMFAPDGRSLYLRLDAGSGPNIIRRAALLEGTAPTEYIGSIDRTFTLAFCNVAPLNVRLTGRGIEVWDSNAKTQAGVIEIVCASSLLAVSPDDRLICAHTVDTGSAAAGLTLWSLGERKRLVTVNIPRPKLIAFSADSRRLATISEKQMSVFEISQPTPIHAPVAVVTTPSGNPLPSAQASGDSVQPRLRLINVREIMPSPDHPPTWSYRLMPDGKTLLYAAVKQRGGSYKLKLRDIATGNEKTLPFPSHGHFVELCNVLAANCVTPDGKTLIIYTGIDENADGVIQPTEKKSIALYDLGTGAVRDLGVRDDSVFASLDATGKILFIGATKNNAPFPPTRKIYSTLLDKTAVRAVAIGGSIHQPCPTATLLPVSHPVLSAGPNNPRWPQLYDYYTGKLSDIRHGTGDSPGMWTRNGRYFYALSESTPKFYCWDRVRGERVAQIDDIGGAIGPGPTPSSMVVAHSGGIALHDPENGTMVRMGEQGMAPISAFGRTLIYRTNGYNPTICMAEIEMRTGSAKP